MICCIALVFVLLGLYVQSLSWKKPKRSKRKNDWPLDDADAVFGESRWVNNPEWIWKQTTTGGKSDPGANADQVEFTDLPDWAQKEIQQAKPGSFVQMMKSGDALQINPGGAFFNGRRVVSGLNNSRRERGSG